MYIKIKMSIMMTKVSFRVEADDSFSCSSSSLLSNTRQEDYFPFYSITTTKSTVPPNHRHALLHIFNKSIYSISYTKYVCMYVILYTHRASNYNITAEESFERKLPSSGYTGLALVPTPLHIFISFFPSSSSIKSLDGPTKDEHENADDYEYSSSARAASSITAVRSESFVKKEQKKEAVEMSVMFMRKNKMMMMMIMLQAHE